VTTAPVGLHGAVRPASEIAAELRREFQLEFQARTGSAPAATDPVLAALFHAFAMQVSQLYEDAERVLPLAVLDDLVSVLGLPARRAQPAQTVLRFSGIDEPELLGSETEILGFLRNGDQVVLTPDEPIQVSSARLAFAAAYEAGRLVVLAGAATAEGIPLPPGEASARFGGAGPFLLLAVEPGRTHLSGLGIHLDVQPLGGPAQRALARSPWQLLDADGVVRQELVLRTVRGRGGVRRLAWLQDEVPSSHPSGVASALALGEGPYGAAVFVWPEVPADRRAVGSPPPAIRPLLERLVPPECEASVAGPLAWIQIPLPAGLRGIPEAVNGASLHCVTGSNIEIWSDQVLFERSGQVVELRPEGDRGRHVLGVLSVIGEGGELYRNEADVEAALEAGRYRQSQSRFQFRPALQPSGRLDAYAMLRILLSDGARANGLEIGDVRRVTSKTRNVTLQVTNLTVSRGGASPPDAKRTRLRLAELLRTRERVVTPMDFDVAARSFDERIERAEVVPRVAMDDGVVRVIDHVTVHARARDFADPPAEMGRLCDDLREHLQQCTVLGHVIEVSVAPAS
jgi:hypothetical protein